MLIEKTQPGNPHNLTKLQHIHTKRCIGEFAEDGLVWVYWLKQEKYFQAKPNNQVFCAKRSWDEWAEHVLMGKIENEFHAEVERVLAGRAVSNHLCVSEYLALWKARSFYDLAPPGDLPLDGEVTHCWTKDEEEQLEKNVDAQGRPIKTHLIFPQNDRIPGRVLVGEYIRTAVNNFISRYPGLKWSVVRLAESTALLFPDFPTVFTIPISPTIFLHAEWPVCDLAPQLLCRDEVCWQTNAILMRRAKRWVFSSSKRAIENALSEAH